MDICAATSSSEKNGIKVRFTIHSKSQKDKKLAKSKKTKAFKRASSNSGSKATLIRRASDYLSSSENGSSLPGTPSSSSDKVGNEAQESSNPHTKRDNSTKRASPTDTLGWFEKELRVAWKNLFPITLANLRTGDLAFEHPAWGSTPNQWWKFLINILLITEKDAEALNKQRRPLVVPQLDE